MTVRAKRLKTTSFSVVGSRSRHRRTVILTITYLPPCFFRRSTAPRQTPRTAYRLLGRYPHNRSVIKAALYPRADPTFSGFRRTISLPILAATGSPRPHGYYSRVPLLGSRTGTSSPQAKSLRRRHTHPVDRAMAEGRGRGNRTLRSGQLHRHIRHDVTVGRNSSSPGDGGYSSLWKILRAAQTHCCSA